MGKRDYVMVTSAGSCSTGEVASVGTVELVCAGGLLRMGGESISLPVWRSVGGGLTGKGELDAWVVWTHLSDSQESSMRWEQDALGWRTILPRILPSPPGGWIRLNVLGVVRQRKLFSAVTGKRSMSKVSSGLGWYQNPKSGISLTTVNDSMVVRRSNSHR